MCIQDLNTNMTTRMCFISNTSSKPKTRSNMKFVQNLEKLANDIDKTIPKNVKIKIYKISHSAWG